MLLLLLLVWSQFCSCVRSNLIEQCVSVFFKYYSNHLQNVCCIIYLFE